MNMVSRSRVYVGRLHALTRERDLEKFFRGYGKINDIIMKKGFAFVEFEDPMDAKDAVQDLDGKQLLGNILIVELATGMPRGPGGVIEGSKADDWYVSKYGRTERETDRFSYSSDREDRQFRYRDRSRSDRDSSRSSPGGASRSSRRRSRDKESESNFRTRTGHRVDVENLSSRVDWQDLKDFMRQVGDVAYAEKSGTHTGVVEFTTSAFKKAALKKLDGLELFGRRVKLRDGSSKSKSRSRSGSKSRSKSSNISRSSESPAKSAKKRSRSRSKSAEKEKETKRNKRASSSADTKSDDSDDDSKTGNAKDNA